MFLSRIPVLEREFFACPCVGVTRQSVLSAPAKRERKSARERKLGHVKLAADVNGTRRLLTALHRLLLMISPDFLGP